MDNDTTGNITTPENDTQESPMPSENQQTAQPSEVEETAGQETEQAASTKSEAETLPENASERTRDQFEKLRNQLREEKTRREYMESVFQSTQTKPPEPVQEQPIYDPNTETFDYNRLNDVQKRTYVAEQRAARAEQAVQQYLHEQENRETYKEFPELNPNDMRTFNKDLHVTTRQILLDSMVNPQDYNNKQLSFREAATLAKTRLPGAIESAKKEGAKEAMEQLTPKEQASLEAVGSPSRRGEALGELEELRRKTRKGDSRASIERMKRILSQK